MKTGYKYLFLLAAVVFGLTACEQEKKREPSPTTGTSVVAFEQGDIQAEINPNKVALAYDIKIARTNADSALTVKINAEGDVDIIKVPASATFAAGVSEVTVQLTFPNAQVDSTYTVVLSLDSINQSPYLDGTPKCTFTAIIGTWEVSETPAIFVDGVVCSPFGMTPIAWYVNFQSKLNADGSKDYRFFNPYRANKGSEDPDNFGVYSWFVYNSGETVDMKNDYNWEIHVDATGMATFAKTYLGPDYGYGPALIWMVADFYAQKQGTAPDYATYGAGAYDATADAIIFPAGTYLWYFDGYGGNLASLPQTIYLDSKDYQDNHLSIDDYNDPSIEWVEQTSEVNLFESSITNFSNDEQKLFKAKDPYAGNPKSPFIDLYCLKDVYSEGANLAFYWNGEKEDTLDIPVPQNTLISIMGKELLIVEAEGIVTTSTVKGTDVSVFTFALTLASKEGDLVGTFVETFSMAGEPIVFSKEDFIGNFIMKGYSQFTDAAESVNVTIAEEDSVIVLHGIQYCSGLLCDFDAEKGTLSVAPQVQDSIYGAYDIAFYTTTAAGVSTKAALEFGFGLDGIAKLTKTSEADGYLVRSEAANGWLAGHYDLSLTPALVAPTAPAKAPAINGAYDWKKHEVRANNGLSFIGKYQRSVKSQVIR